MKKMYQNSALVFACKIMMFRICTLSTLKITREFILEPIVHHLIPHSV